MEDFKSQMLIRKRFGEHEYCFVMDRPDNLFAPDGPSNHFQEFIRTILANNPDGDPEKLAEFIYDRISQWGPFYGRHDRLHLTLDGLARYKELGMSVPADDQLACLPDQLPEGWKVVRTRPSGWVIAEQV